ncbi:cell growth regulator with EF hand domain protein 1 [Microcaecilia unicolor]|uniref:Cell growth regulator with EF hand domain protein 1 n=1 Tax=Microcaecilia unicolor TaxID=1415580 RepID=A0A6P7XDU5_9AMPH|nr:cell growth regulator with EF hand domain protein 1 [Microcaecilia unicolor]
MRGSVCGFLLLLVSQIKAAPKALLEERLDTPNDISLASISNPFGFGEDEVRLLKNYLKSSKEIQGDLENMTREQVLLYLFAFYDYDKSGYLDGLDLLKLLCDVWSQHCQSQSSSELVVQLVDELLEKQDLNGDGLLNPSELLTPPVESHISKTAGEVKREEVNDLPPEPQKETTTIKEGLQGHEEPQVAGEAPFNQQGSDILENLERNANDPVIEAEETVLVETFDDDDDGVQQISVLEEM